MVAPLIAGAARVATTAKKTKSVSRQAGKNRSAIAARRSTRQRDMSPSGRPAHRNERRDTHAHERFSTPIRNRREYRAGEHYTRNNKEATSLKRKVRAAIRAYVLTPYFIAAYALQLCFAFLFIQAVGMMNTSGVIIGVVDFISFGTFTDAVTNAAGFVARFSWFMVIMIGFFCLTMAIFSFSTTKVQVFRHHAVIIAFAFCLWGYMAPYVFIFPWVFLLMTVIVLVQE